MPNKAFIKGGPSPNPQGRRLQTKASKSIKGALDRFLAGRMKLSQLNKLYDKLQPREQAQFIVDLLPYRFPKLSAVSVKARIEGADKEAIDELHAALLPNINSPEDFITSLMNEPLQLPEPIKQPA